MRIRVAKCSRGLHTALWALVLALANRGTVQGQEMNRAQAEQEIRRYAGLFRTEAGFTEIRGTFVRACDSPSDDRAKVNCILLTLFMSRGAEAAGTSEAMAFAVK